MLCPIFTRATEDNKECFGKCPEGEKLNIDGTCERCLKNERLTNDGKICMACSKNSVPVGDSCIECQKNEIYDADKV